MWQDMDTRLDSSVAERFLGKKEVLGSIPSPGSRFVQERSDWLQIAVL